MPKPYSTTHPHDLDPAHPLLKAALAEHGADPDDLRYFMTHGRSHSFVTPGAAEIVYHPDQAVIHRHRNGDRWVMIHLGGQRYSQDKSTGVYILGLQLTSSIEEALPGRFLSDLLPVPGANEVVIESVGWRMGRVHVLLEPHPGIA